ncbi:hypothetical protein [Litorimonas sp.]|uniref:hypothetical protein n=1 Tax=Litorimonas sp. TaxID=1892381 RepID=UPI003A85DE8A
MPDKSHKHESDSGQGESLDELLRRLRPYQKARQKKFEILFALVKPIFAKFGISVSSVGGSCPLQIEGRFDGVCYYFRARGEEFSFTVAATQEEIFNSPIYCFSQQYGDWPDAGHMSRFEGLLLVGYCVNLARQALSKQEGDK